jgi:hypothetical protein
MARIPARLQPSIVVPSFTEHVGPISSLRISLVGNRHSWFEPDCGARDARARVLSNGKSRNARSLRGARDFSHALPARPCFPRLRKIAQIEGTGQGPSIQSGVIKQALGFCQGTLCDSRRTLITSSSPGCSPILIWHGGDYCVGKESRGPTPRQHTHGDTTATKQSRILSLIVLSRKVR